MDMVRLLRIIMYIFACLVCPARGEAMEQQVRLQAVSAATAGDLVTEYFAESGYRVRQTFPAGGTILIFAGKDDEAWEVVVSPHTALGAKVQVVRPESSKVTAEKFIKFWLAVEGRSQELPPQKSISTSKQGYIPAAVRANGSAVACIRVLSAGRHIQFSGFVIDGSGLVLCTAHDLRAHEEVRVMFATGVDYLGEIIKLDLHRDLALIRIKARHENPISLVRDAALLEMGEAIYTIGCPEPLIGAIYAGVIDSPPRKADNLVLYQASITINPGSSGSPVFDSTGRLAAMVKGRYRSTKNIGFLIPLPTINDFLHDIVKTN